MSDSETRSGNGVGGESREGPRVWVLLDDRPGNSTQSLGLAEALGWPFQVVDLRFGLLSRLHNRWLGASVRGLDAVSRASLEPPWPDLVIAAGRRNAPVALWIRHQSRGRSKLVQLGRKGADRAELFDLAVTPAYTRQRPHPRRVEITGPLHRIQASKLEAEAERWRETLSSGPPGPLLALLVGGTSGQYRLDENTARRLGTSVSEMARETGAALLVSVSRRTAPAVGDILEETLSPVARFYRWSPSDDANPYLGYLALADAFVITGDSESMLMEACSTGKPVWIFPLPVRASFRALHYGREWVVRQAVAYRKGGRRRYPGVGALCDRWIEQGYVRPARNLDRMHFDLVERGLAGRFGSREPRGAKTDREGDRELVARAVRDLWASR